MGASSRIPLFVYDARALPLRHGTVPLVATADTLPTPAYQARNGLISGAVPMPDSSAGMGPAEAFAGPDPLVGENRLRVFFGTGQRADFIGHPDLPHTYSYVPDIAAGLATLGTDARAAGQVWHLPGPATVTTRALLDLVAAEVGHPVGIRSVSKLAVRALGLVNPMMRALAEMSYDFDQPFILTTSKYQAAFGAAGTQLNLSREAR